MGGKDGMSSVMIDVVFLTAGSLSNAFQFSLFLLQPSH